MKTLCPILVGAAILTAGAIVDVGLAQPAAPRPPAPAAPPPPNPDYDLQSAREAHGTVQRFTLAPGGELDGFLLADGTQVHLPPHLSADLAAAVRPGDQVAVRGYRLTAAPLIVAATVTDFQTNQTVVDRGPPPPGVAPPPPPANVPAQGAQQVTAAGKVQRPLYGPAGDLNGAVLEDGAILRFPPPTAYRVASLLAPGQAITMQGWALNTAYGRVIDAQEISAASAPPPGPPAAPYR